MSGLLSTKTGREWKVGPCQMFTVLSLSSDLANSCSAERDLVQETGCTCKYMLTINWLPYVIPCKKHADNWVTWEFTLASKLEISLFPNYQTLKNTQQTNQLIQCIKEMFNQGEILVGETKFLFLKIFVLVFLSYKIRTEDSLINEQFL